MQEMAMKEAAAKLAAAEAGAGKAEAEAMIAQMTAQAMQNTGGASMGDIIRQAISADDNKTRILVAEMEREEEAMRLARNQDISWQELEAKMQDKERDRQIEVMFKEQEMQSVQARNQADEFSKGFKLRLEANEQRIRSLNMQKGFDSI
jgi:ABC-type Na+ transport system ATPase subunit NatA